MVKPHNCGIRLRCDDLLNIEISAVNNENREPEPSIVSCVK